MAWREAACLAVAAYRNGRDGAEARPFVWSKLKPRRPARTVSRWLAATDESG